MDFKTLLRNRRAIREFQDREVPLDIVKEILRIPAWHQPQATASRAGSSSSRTENI